MSWKRTLGLVVVVAVMAGYYFWYEVKGGEQRKQAEEVAQRIFQLKKDAIEGVTLKREKESIKLAREGDAWMLTEPVRARADRQTVDEVLDGLVEGKRDKVVAEQASDVGEFGLKEPALVVEASIKDAAEPTVLQFGSRTPTFSGYYAREGEQSKILVVSSSLQSKFDKTVFSLRDKSVLTVEQAQVKRVEVQQGEQVIAAEAEGDGGWKLAAPLEAKADKTKVSELLTAINGAKVKEFIEETPADLGKYGLQPPRTRLAFFLGDDRAEKSLLLGDEDTAKGGLYARRGATEPVFIVETKLKEKVPKDASDWRDRTLLAVKRDQVEKVAVQSGSETTEVACIENCGKIPDDKWQIKQPLDAKADAIKVRTLLRNLEDLKVKTFVAEAADALQPYGLDSPSAQVRVWLKEKSEPTTLLVGREDPEKGGSYVKVPERPAVYLIESKDRSDIVKLAPDLRDRKLLAFKAKDVRKIEIVHPDRTVVLEGDGDSWSQTKPEKAKLEAYKARSLLWKLEDLEFKDEWKPTEVAADAHGLESPSATVTLSLQGGKKVDTLKLGKKVADKELIYAQLESSRMIYSVDAKILSDLPKGTGDI